ncbi:MAG: hypothetical protein WCW02_01620 [Candidatus Buchananbacteria bacterium]
MSKSKKQNNQTPAPAPAAPPADPVKKDTIISNLVDTFGQGMIPEVVHFLDDLLNRVGFRDFVKKMYAKNAFGTKVALGALSVGLQKIQPKGKLGDFVHDIFEGLLQSTRNDAEGKIGTAGQNPVQPVKGNGWKNLSETEKQKTLMEMLADPKLNKEARNSFLEMLKGQDFSPEEKQVLVGLLFLLKDPAKIGIFLKANDNTQTKELLTVIGQIIPEEKEVIVAAGPDVMDQLKKVWEKTNQKADNFSKTVDGWTASINKYRQDKFGKKGNRQ